MNIAQAKQQAVSENQFYGCASLLNMQRFFEKSIDVNITKAIVDSTLDAAWHEAKDSKPKRELFYTILVSAGDITNRQHNMFGGIKVEQGGHAKRKAFRYALDWMLRKQNATFYSLLPLIPEYTNYENLFYNQLRTDRKNGKLQSHEWLPIDHDKVADYLSSRIAGANTSEFELQLIAKFLPKTPSKKRWRKDKEGNTTKKEKKEHTLTKDGVSFMLIKALSKRMNWAVVEYPNNTRYVGYEKFRSEHLKLTEAHLFSSKKICAFGSTQFLVWLEQLPSAARYRVQCRLVNKEGAQFTTKGVWKLTNDADMGELYIGWLKTKEEANKRLLAMTTEEKNDMNKTELKALKKTAKINTGATTLFDSLKELYRGKAIFELDAENELKLQAILDNVKLEVPVMVCIDSSGSMGGNIQVEPGFNIDRIEFAKFVAAVMLYKNPDPNLASMFLNFGQETNVHYDGGESVVTHRQNHFVSGQLKRVKVDALMDRKKTFAEGYRQVQQLLYAGGYTHLTTMTATLKAWVDSDPSLKEMRKEIVANYPVWLLISDGAFNNGSSKSDSVLEFKRELLHYFGANPVIVLWDIVDSSAAATLLEKPAFSDIDNFVHIGGFNPATLNNVFTKIGDHDVIDIYITLKTLHSNTRYAPVQAVVV